MVLLLIFPQMWWFPYPFGFCNPVRIYRRKINGDDDDDDDDDDKDDDDEHLISCMFPKSGTFMNW